jgi:hypothetical protein
LFDVGNQCVFRQVADIKQKKLCNPHEDGLTGQLLCLEPNITPKMILGAIKPPNLHEFGTMVFAKSGGQTAMKADDELRSEGAQVADRSPNKIFALSHLHTILGYV